MKRAVKSLANAFGYEVRHTDPQKWFIEFSRDHASLVARFRQIHDQIPCHHHEQELHLMADFLLRSPLPGAIVECGCYKGGSTAKLSLVAGMTGRRIVVCDSFQGLPEPPEQDRLHHRFGFGDTVAYHEGQCAGSLDEVRNNIRRFGALEFCDFLPGFFADTLSHLQVDDLSLVFLDVDYISSARECLRVLWPKLAKTGRLYTHEARSEEFIYGITDHSWWRETFGYSAPLLIGAGYGCGPTTCVHEQERYVKWSSLSPLQCFPPSGTHNAKLGHCRAGSGWETILRPLLFSCDKVSLDVGQ